MKFYKNNNKTGNNLIDFSDINVNNIEEKKILLNKYDINSSIENYCCFQKFSFFKWPLWVQPADSESIKFIKQVTPLFLSNTSAREWNSFTNFLSRDEIFIDPSGMLSPSYDLWSIEIWVLIDKKIFRSQENYGNVRAERNNETSIINIQWDEKPFHLTQTVYGARSNSDEAVIDIKCNLKEKNKNASLLIVSRPYNQLLLGTINKINYSSSDRLLSINGSKKIGVGSNPNFIISGNGDIGDIGPETKHSNAGTICKNGMATMALGYKLDKSNNLFNLRISLDGQNDLKAGNYNYNNLKKDYISYAKIRIENGMEIKIQDSNLMNLFSGSKTTVLNFTEKDLYHKIKGNGAIDCRSFYYILYGYNRMGFFSESKKLIDLVLKNFPFNDKNIDFSSVVDICYILSAFGDYFLHTRDTDYIQLNYNNYFRNFASAVYKYTSKIKSIDDLSVNSIDVYLFKKGHCFDIVLFSFSMKQLSYFARCIGIFGDEKKFEKESERLAGIFKKDIAKYENESFAPEDDFFYFEIYSGFPFKLNGLSADYILSIINRVIDCFGPNLINNRSLGLDIFSSAILANNLLLLKDDRAAGIIDELLGIISKSFRVPEYINKQSEKGCWGNGCNKITGSILFALVRNRLFVDKESRLDVFPNPSEEWFKAGKEIVVKNAPSRFGMINFRMKSTTNEIQFYFEGLPKYVPPDIMINLPFKVKLLEGDDFIMKKSIGNSYIINGWPTQVRFLRKK